MTFSLYNTENGETAIWSEDQNVPVTGGIYNVELGTQTPLTLGMFDNDLLYLEVVIRNPDTGIDELLSPRHLITSTAFAMKAGVAEVAYDADTVEEKHASYFLDTSNNTQTN